MVGGQCWTALNKNVHATGYNGQTICQPITHWCSMLCVYINAYVYTYVKSIFKKKYQRVCVAATII